VDAHAYALKELLGSGAFSDVYKVEKDKELFALKVYSTSFLVSAKDQRIKEERALAALAAAAASVPRIVEFIEVRYLSPSYSKILSLPGLVLALGTSILPARGGEAVEMTLFIHVLHALKTAHSLMIAHTDVKPDNMFLRDDEGGRKLMLGDWSSCSFVSEEARPFVFGTIGYVDCCSRDSSLYALDLIALVKSAHASYRSLRPPGEPAAIALHWTREFREGTIWAAAVQRAEACDYAALEDLFKSL
jgi:serine/threonine protein kinase